MLCQVLSGVVSPRISTKRFLALVKIGGSERRHGCGFILEGIVSQFLGMQR